MAVLEAQASVEMAVYKGNPGKTVSVPDTVTHTNVSKGKNYGIRKITITILLSCQFALLKRYSEQPL